MENDIYVDIVSVFIIGGFENTIFEIKAKN